MGHLAPVNNFRKTIYHRILRIKVLNVNFVESSINISPTMFVAILSDLPLLPLWWFHDLYVGT